MAQPEGEDVFVHHTAIQMNGYRSLERGATVEFELTEGPKGLQAVEVQARPARPDLTGSVGLEPGPDTHRPQLNKARGTALCCDPCRRPRRQGAAPLPALHTVGRGLPPQGSGFCGPRWPSIFSASASSSPSCRCTRGTSAPGPASVGLLLAGVLGRPVRECAAARAALGPGRAQSLCSSCR